MAHATQWPELESAHFPLRSTNLMDRTERSMIARMEPIHVLHCPMHYQAGLCNLQPDSWNQIDKKSLTVEVMVVLCGWSEVRRVATVAPTCLHPACHAALAFEGELRPDIEIVEIFHVSHPL